MCQTALTCWNDNHIGPFFNNQSVIVMWYCEKAVAFKNPICLQMCTNWNLFLNILGWFQFDSTQKVVKRGFFLLKSGPQFQRTWILLQIVWQ